MRANNFYSGSYDYFEQVALGNIPDRSVVGKFGRLLASTSEQIVWDNGNGYVFLEGAEKMSIVSDDVNDNIVGSGARVVRVFGLDDNHQPITEDIELNGVTPVLTVNEYHRFNRMFVVSDGNGLAIAGSNTGTITATAETTAAIQAQINPHEGQTLMCIFTIPEGYTGLLWSEADSLGRLREATFRLKWRNDSAENNGSFSTKSIRDLYEFAWQKENKIPTVISEKTDIVVTCVATASITVSASFTIELVKN